MDQKPRRDLTGVLIQPIKDCVLREPLGLQTYCTVAVPDVPEHVVQSCKHRRTPLGSGIGVHWKLHWSSPRRGGRGREEEGTKRLISSTTVGIPGKSVY